MELADNNGYECLLRYLTAADTAALRLASRGWQALVDRCLTKLQPFAVTTAFFSLNSTPCLLYRSPYQHSSVRHHPINCGAPNYALHAVAGQLTALHTLSVDAHGKVCGDFEALRHMRALRRLHIAQFSFADDALQDGIGQCRRLQVLHLESQQAMLQPRSLAHLTGMSHLQELLLRPRGYLHVPPDSAQGVAALGQLTSLTSLAMLTAIKPPCHSVSGEASGLAGPVPEPLVPPAAAGAAGGGAVAGAAGGTLEGHPLYFSAAGTHRLSDSLGQLKGLKVLRLTGIAMLPPAVAGLTQLQELSLERVGGLDRPAVASLCSLKQLTGLTLITAADQQQMQQQQGQQQQLQPGGGGGAGNDGSLAAAAAAQLAAEAGRSAAYLPLLQLPALRELALGSVHRSQQLNLTGSISASLQGRSQHRGPGGACGGGSSGGGSDAAGSNGGSSGGLQSNGGSSSSCGRWYPQAGEGVSAFVCPTNAWSDLATVKGLQHIVVVRGWHSAAVTAVFPSFAAAVAAYMCWPQLPLTPWLPPPQAGTGGPTCSSSLSYSSSSSGSSSAVGVFHNHPVQGCFIPALPQLLVLVLQPSMQSLAPQHKMLVAQLLHSAGSGGSSSGGGGGLAGVAAAAAAAGGGGANLQPGTLTLQQPGLGMNGGWRAHADSVARCMLLAQLQSSMHHSKLLVVLGASATHLTRLELTVDQSWPPSVLASLGQLEPLRQLAVLKLDCGRQQPPQEMWEGLSRLTGLRWLVLRWLDRLPVAHLAPLTNLVALQLKNIDKPPGVAQLAEVLHGMPHLTALAIEGALLDADEDWLQDMVGLMRHGRWTSSWVEHILCREYKLRVLGSITGALLMSALLNSNRWPEMLVSALLAAVAGAIFVMAVAASLLQLVFDPARHRGAVLLKQQQHQGYQQQQQQKQGHQLMQEIIQSMQQGRAGLAGAAAAANAAAPAAAAASAANAVGAVAASVSRGISRHVSSAVLWLFWRYLSLLQFWLLGGWLVTAARLCGPWLLPHLVGSSGAGGEEAAAEEQDHHSTSSSSSDGDSSRTWLSLVLQFAAVCATLMTAGSSALQSLQQTASQSAAASGAAANRSPAAAAAAHDSNGGSGSTTAITDPGSAFRRLRLLSFRRCTLSHSNNSVSNKAWQLSVLASQMAPGLGAQLVAVGLALILWPLAVLAAISRIAATSGTFYSSNGSSGSSGGLSSSGGRGLDGVQAGGYSYSRRSKWSIWAWGWDLVCGLLQGAANRVEGAATGCGPVVAVAACMPELRFLDLTWLNLEPWELHAVAQVKQLHYLGLSRQQVGIVASREAVFARNCSRGRRGSSASSSSIRYRPSPAVMAGLAAQQGCVVGQAVAAAGAPGSKRGVGMLFAAWLYLLTWPLFLLSWPLRYAAGGWGSHVGSGIGSGGSWWQEGSVGGAGGSGVGVGVQGGGVDLTGLCEDWPDMMLVESPSGFDEVIEREFV